MPISRCVDGPAGEIPLVPGDEPPREVLSLVIAEVRCPVEMTERVPHTGTHPTLEPRGEADYECRLRQGGGGVPPVLAQPAPFIATEPVPGHGPQTGGIAPIYWIACCITVGRHGLRDLRVDVDELRCPRLVVAGTQVVEAGLIVSILPGEQQRIRDHHATRAKIRPTHGDRGPRARCHAA